MESTENSDQPALLQRIARETVSNDFERLMELVRGGSQEAAWELLERIGPHVHRVVHRMLNRELRSKFDSMDFVQAVWMSFFDNRREIATFTRPEQLIGFLIGMARHKVIDEQRRRFTSIKYNVRREQSLADQPATAETSKVHADASPSQYAMARECWNRLIDGQPELHRQIVMRKYLGDSHGEIAERLGINPRTVTRVLNRLLSQQVA